MENALLSVCLITYNHAQYIRQTIDGVLMQKVNFPWEVIIADDCSTDGTREILNEYKSRHPELIKLLLQERNVGAARNWMDLLNAPRSKYIAYVEGDDYWTDPFKLQKQVDFLEAHSTCVMVYHPVKIVEKNGQEVKDYIADSKFNLSESNIYNLVTFGNYIHSPSIVFRNGHLDFPPGLDQVLIGDFCLYVLLAQHGWIKRLDDTMAVYRNNAGVYSGKAATYKRQAWIGAIEFLQQNLSDETAKKILALRVGADDEVVKNLKISGLQRLTKYLSIGDLFTIFYKKLTQRFQ